LRRRPPEPNSSRETGGREQRDFGQCLPNQTTSRCAQRAADSKLSKPPTRTREHQQSRVGAAEQEKKPDQNLKHQ